VKFKQRGQYTAVSVGPARRAFFIYFSTFFTEKQKKKKKNKNHSTGIGSGDDHGFAFHGRRSAVDARRQPIVQLENG